MDGDLNVDGVITGTYVLDVPNLTYEICSA